jgi:hypothetical protein
MQTLASQLSSMFDPTLMLSETELLKLSVNEAVAGKTFLVCVHAQKTDNKTFKT